MSVAVRTLEQWLSWMEAQHPSAIELGLTRVRSVAERLGLTRLQSKVITVGGTNGKGSTCAMLEALALAHGLKVAVYSSPHILRYAERVRLLGHEARDDELIASFEAVEAARGGVPLTFFEFSTLAALWLFAQQPFDLVVLEVGLGGRLDAVNSVEPDVSVVTTVAIDHRDWLGDTIEQIAFEKAGIYRAAKPALFGDNPPPASLRQHAAAIAATLLVQGEAFGFEQSPDRVSFWVGPQRFEALPRPSLLPINCATALAAFVHAGFAVRREALAEALERVQLAGRFQAIAAPVATRVDVAHNPQAAAKLAELLDAAPVKGRTLAVVAMLADKDIAGTLACLTEHVDSWFVAGLSGPRGTDAAVLAEALSALGQRCSCHAEVSLALAAAWAAARDDDRVIVFGSFHTVAAAISHASAK